MPQSVGVILVVLFSFIAVGQCKSPTFCKDAAEVKYTEKNQGASGATWEKLTTMTAGFSNERGRAELCRDNCERRCKGHSRSGWTNCIAFSSRLEEGYSNKCYCYGWNQPLIFSSKSGYLSGWCVSDWFDSYQTY